MTGELITVEQTDIITSSQEALDQNPAAVYLASLQSAQSRRTMRGALERIADKLASGATAATFPWSRVRYQHVVALSSALLDEMSYSTANKYLSAIRRVMQEAWRLGQIDAQTYQKIADVPNVKGETTPAGRSISSGELHALMDVCMADQSPAGPRDAAMIAILYSCGLRRAELVGLDLGDYDQESGALAVRGKRNKERIAYAVNGTIDALADWLAIRGDAPGALFWAIRKGGHLQRGQRLTSQGAYHVLGKRAEQAGVKELSPHDLRRTFVGDLLDAGADISTVQRLAGHANVQTTARYDRRPEAAKRRAAALLHVPYRRQILDGAGCGDVSGAGHRSAG